MTRDDVIAALEEMATLLELAGENPFKVRAFQNGARVLESISEPLAEMIASGALRTVKGIGSGLFQDIRCLVETGSLPALDALRARTPAGLLEMMELPGLGVKKVRALHDGLGIASVGELEYAISENRLLELSGFGHKTQAKLSDAIVFWKRHRGQRLLADVLGPAELLLSAIEQRVTGRATLVGDLRRRCETVDRIEILLCGVDPVQASLALGAVPGLEAAEGDWAYHGMPVYVHHASPSEEGLALLFQTGSAGFLVELVELARAQGFHLSREGLRQGDRPLEAPSEAQVFETLGLWPMPPETRETGRLADWSRQVPSPQLVVLSDIQGAFHLHSHYSDGSATLAELVHRARAMGWRYLGISDHSETAVYARGLRRERVAEQLAEINGLRETFPDIVIFSGIEADILADGDLDYDDETLSRFDFVIGSVHARHGQDGDTMTKRLVKALAHPRLTMLGHLSGRLLLAREASAIDMEAVLTAAAQHRKVIELNANPHRLDIDWRWLPRARELGIPIAINPDAHSLEGMSDVRWGVEMARKGGLNRAQVWNTRPAEAIEAELRE
ncbi:MAG: PHP domain-containing protein [Candidatus Sericytochromatia bacterium]|nr:PHP domain-containing protein [Candidatus Sericytochromatia bacterium]